MGVHDQYFFGSEQGQVASSSERSNEPPVTINLRAILWGVDGLLASQEKLCSVELVVACVTVYY